MSRADIQRFSRPYDWDSIDAAIHEAGGVIAEGLFTDDEVDALNGEIDAYLVAHADAGLPASGSEGYDRFLGHRSVLRYSTRSRISSRESDSPRPSGIAESAGRRSSISARGTPNTSPSASISRTSSSVSSTTRP